MPSEFDVIRHYFQHRQVNRPDVDLALGDDCALVSVADGFQVAISTDTAVVGTHFLADADPVDVAYKVLMSNISDLAAMGATPAWVSMAISLPAIDEVWLSSFCSQFFELADQHNLQLIGGDTTQGPLSISLTIQGLIPTGQALTRSNAQVGDLIYISGNLGDSKAGLSLILDPSLVNNLDKKIDEKIEHYLIKKHFRAESRIKLGEALRSIANSCIDVSDGLLADLSHILKASQVGAELDIDKIPVSSQVVEFYADKSQAQIQALTSGEEYQLCFSVPKSKQHLMESLNQIASCECIGKIVESSQAKLTLIKDNHEFVLKSHTGFDHFSN